VHSAYKLNHVLTIKHNASNGTTDDDWQTLCTVWAEKSGLKGRLFFEASAQQSESSATFTIHYRTGIKPGMHIIDNGDEKRPYEVKGDLVDPDDNRRWLEIHARRIEQGGD
jgi:SPP1 family predicted phage head-tail adaptor